MIQSSAQLYAGTDSGAVRGGTVPKNRSQNRFPVPVLLHLGRMTRTQTAKVWRLYTSQLYRSQWKSRGKKYISCMLSEHRAQRESGFYRPWANPNSPSLLVGSTANPTGAQQYLGSGSLAPLVWTRLSPVRTGMHQEPRIVVSR